MKKKFLLVILFLFPVFSFAQYAYRITPVSALPASCNPANGSVVTLTTGVAGIYKCGPALNTWSLVGPGGASNQFVLNQGTITASAPFALHTATWNNAGVDFINFDSNVTNTASGPNSLLFRLRINGINAFTLDKFGSVQIPGTMTIGTTLYYSWLGASKIWGETDGNIRLSDFAGTFFDTLILGSQSPVSPGIMTVTANNHTQGIIIARGDGTFQTFVNLEAAAVNGAMIYCADCTIANPCAGGGTGAIAKRLNGVWVCN